MSKVIYDKNIQKVPVKIWSDLAEVETHAIDQLKNIASLPFVFKHVAAMPDVHLGKGATVGSVIATKGAVIPAAVGVDIGCGMMAARISNINADLIRDKIVEIRSAIEEAVPVGHRGNNQISNGVVSWIGWESFNDINALGNHSKIRTDLEQRALSQLGSLGGGNHFIELCTDEDNFVWIMLHSGSRNIGKSIAEIHINKAKDLMKKMFIDLRDPDLAYFASQTKEYDEYISDLMWAQSYASQNREIMFERIVSSIKDIVDENMSTDNHVNCHHNYASKENHYGEGVLVTRKGAVRARSGDLGIIPGSMGTRSYIVRGLGNPESFHSCSHGAGRRMSRAEARRKFTIDDLKTQTLGIECRKDDGVLDEIPGAYKDIDKVMENQKDLVEVVAVLKQFMCIKG